MNDWLQDEYGYVISDVKEYGKTRWEWLKLKVLDKLGRIAGLLLFGFALILLFFAILVGGGIALIYALSTCMPTWGAALIVTAIWALVLTAVILMRKQLFINPMLAAMAEILLTDKPAKKLTEDTLRQQTEMVEYKAQAQEMGLQREAKRVERSWTQVVSRLSSVGNLLRTVLGWFKRS